MIHSLNINVCICTWSSKTNNKHSLTVMSIIPKTLIVHQSSLLYYVKNYFGISNKEGFEKSKLCTEIDLNQKNMVTSSISSAICVRKVNKDLEKA